MAELTNLIGQVDMRQERDWGKGLLLRPNVFSTPQLTMTDTLTINPLGEDPSLVQTCRHHHQTWAATLAQHEQEIDQLLALLADLLERDNYRSLRHRAIDYYGDFNHLKSRFQRLRLDLICEGVTCLPTQKQGCREPRFGLFTTIEANFRLLTDEFSRIKSGCYQFLSVMVTLNLL